MSRRRTKTITREEFDKLVTLRRGYLDLCGGETTWEKIPKQEKIRFERDYLALETKLYHTLGFTEREQRTILQLKDAQERLDLYQELSLAEDKMLREQNNKEGGTFYPGFLSELDRLKHEDPERFKKEQEAFNKPTSFSEAFDKLNKINK